MGFIRVCIALLALSLLASCVMDGDGTSSSSSQAVVHKGKPGNSIKISGEDYTLGDIITHPMFRQTLNQFIKFQQVYAEAAKQGIEVSDDEITEEIDLRKEHVTASGQNWDEYLEMQGITDVEFKQMIKTQKLFERLMDTKLDMSDEALHKYWDENKDQVLTTHIQRNFLPESERPSLTFEDCVETIKDSIRMRDGYTCQQDVNDELALNATLDLSEVLDAEAAAEAYALLLGNEQDKIRQRKQEVEEKDTQEREMEKEGDAVAAEGDEPAESESAEAVEETTGEAVAKDNEAAKEDAGKSEEPEKPAVPQDDDQAE